MHITCVNSKDIAKSNDSDHIFVIRENTRLKHRCPLDTLFSLGILQSENTQEPMFNTTTHNPFFY